MGANIWEEHTASIFTQKTPMDCQAWFMRFIVVVLNLSNKYKTLHLSIWNV